MSLSKFVGFYVNFCVSKYIFFYKILRQSPHICPPGPSPGKGPTPALNISRYIHNIYLHYKSFLYTLLTKVLY